MKKIEFIAPVASMRGNLSGGQKLQYAENNNPAFIAPEGRQYAKNYRPTFIGAKRSKDGMTYFATKTKSATLINADSLERMALLGGAAAWYNAVIKNIELYQAMQLFWRAVKDSYPSYTFRQLMMEMFRQCLKSHEENVAFTVSGTTTYAANPWCPDATGIKAQISQEVLIKFWLQLGFSNPSFTPIYYSVNGIKTIALEPNISFDDIINGELKACNTLGLTTETGTGNVKLGSDYLKIGAEYVNHDTVIVANGQYVTTEVAPEP
ncbi:hypothetical protein [Phascolarctobacterium sp.]|uniref:hypothetical protein n=1 Tax=Phascolarctobacterium sp. TaxID=2049039 RepID=UPI00386B99F8